MVLLFFSFSAAVILKLFALADSRQKHSDLTEKAVICAQSAAEVYSVTGDLSEIAKMVFGAEQGTSEIRLDESFRYSENGDILVTLSETEKASVAGKLSYLDISFGYGDKEIYSLGCTSYIPEKGGADDE